MDRKAFITKLASEFPEVVASFDEIDDGLLHLEMAAFRRIVENAMDDGRHWQVELYLRFLDGCLKQADPDLENAILVSFLEDFALDFRKSRQRAVRERMPMTLRNIVFNVNDQWR